MGGRLGGKAGGGVAEEWENLWLVHEMNKKFVNEKIRYAQILDIKYIKKIFSWDFSSHGLCLYFQYRA